MFTIIDSIIIYYFCLEKKTDQKKVKEHSTNKKYTEKSKSMKDKEKPKKRMSIELR